MGDILQRYGEIIKVLNKLWENMHQEKEMIMENALLNYVETTTY
jgi:predicted transcriptional regulator